MEHVRGTRRVPRLIGSLTRRPLVLLAAFVLPAILASTAFDVAAYEERSRAERALEQRSPWRDALGEESSLLLAWSAAPDASEYIVFVSTTPLAGRTAEELLADPLVTKKTTGATAIALQDVLRGPEGTTAYAWVVGARDSETGEITLSESSTFRAVKSYVTGTPASPLIQEVARGSVDVEPYADGEAILLGNGFRFDPVRDGEPQIPFALRATALREGETGSFLVQLDGPVRSGQREQLAAAGAVAFSYLPNYAFLVRMPVETRDAVEDLPFVRWVGTYQPAYKVSAQREMNEVSGVRRLVVLLFPDAEIDATRSMVEALGGSVLEASDSGRNKILHVSVEMALVADIASRSDVAWVEPWHEMRAVNSDAQWVVQTNVNGSRRVWDMGIHGEGQTLMTSDSGVRTSHNMFRDPAVTITTFGDYPTHRKIIAYQKTQEATSSIVFGDDVLASYHGTHTAGSIVGDDSFVGGASAHDGMALKSKLYFMDGGATSTAISTPGDLNLLFGPSYVGNGGGAARISSNSWGGGNATTYGTYDVQTMTVDQFMWDHKDYLVMFSAGNDGPSAGTLGLPGTNKNGVGSGATLNGTSAASLASFSSRGPCDDGRRKPTIVAPGNNIMSASGASDTGIASLSGTSMSCPVTAGATALIRQYLTEGWYPTGAAVPANAMNPSAALLKAMAIGSTDNDMTGSNIPNNNTGWGRIKVDNIAYFAGDTRRLALVDDNDGLATGEFVEYDINVTDTSMPLKISLCWTDREASPTSLRQLVNDLDLTATEPGPVAYKGNVFTTGQSSTGGSRDSINVEEGIRRNTPVAGIWKVRVTATNCPFSPQPFALVISGGMGQNNGVVRLDKLTYGQSDNIEVRVEDTNASSPITVNVSSTTESTPEAISISGTNGVFVGTVPTTAFSPAKNGGEAAIAANGILSVSHGDAITVAYTDASPAATVQATATADFTGPVITNVTATTNASAVDGTVTFNGFATGVTWTTDIPATSRVYYGLTTSLGLASPLDSSLVTSHAVFLEGLLADTTYYFDVESADHIGNATRDDRGGAHYRLTTGKRADVLLVIGDNTFSKDSLYTSALTSLGWTYDVYNAALIPPLVGDKNAGMRAYKTVWWQAGYEQYPPVSNASRDSISKLHDGGARISMVSHDVAWAFTSATSGYFSNPRKTWLNNYLHVLWDDDPLTFSSLVGIAADPISGAYTGGVPYTPHRSGAAGDEINANPGTGTSSFHWRNNDVSPDDIGLRWTNGVNNGSADSSVWGGTPTKLAVNCLEWAQINSSATRQDVLDKTIIWLLGRDHPDAAITLPNGGEVVTTDLLDITGSTTFYGATTQASAAVSVSSDGGASWVPVGFFGPGSDPFATDVDMTPFPNGAEYRLRVAVTDNGTPGYNGADVSNANFTLNRLNGDTRGPVVVAGSILSNPNPQDNANASTLSATVTDVGQGGSAVDAAEWSVGASPAAAGSGTAMTGAFGSTTVAASGTVPALSVSAGARTFWVRAHDAAGNWGSATKLDVVVNGSATGVATGTSLPARFALEQNAPNPFNPATTIRYALPKTSQVELAVYNASGEKVRTLVSGSQPAGYGVAFWDGRNERGAEVTSGVYLYKLKTEGFEDSRKMTLVK